MNIIFLIRPNNHPASRYRVKQYIPFLRQQGVKVKLTLFPKSIFEWARFTKRLRGVDIVFAQKKKINNFWMQRIKKSGAKVVYDVDDAVMFNSSRHESPDSPMRMRKYKKMVERCDGIITGNSYLKSLTEKYNSKIWVLSLSMDMSKYPVKEYKSDNEICSVCQKEKIKDKIVLGWIGGAKSLFFVNNIMPTLEEVAMRHKNLVLKIVCSKFPESSKIEIIKKEWREEDEGQDVRSFDIGLAMLTDDPWSKGKCGTKLLQCMAAGVPSIASPVGVHNEIIDEGINGFLARNRDEWFEKISILVKNAALRKSIGLAGRKTVEENYSLDVNAPKLLEILKRV